MAAYDVHRAFEIIPQLMNMDLKRKGERWEGGYYINGDLHQLRNDKLKVVKWKDDIWIHEEGGDSMPIAKWLQTYGGCSDFVSALRRLRGIFAPIVYDEHEVREKRYEITRYVSSDVLSAARHFPLDKCPLYRWMSGMFGTEAVRLAWEKFNVTSDGKGNAVFWFVDKEGRICHDKRMCYKDDGHRNRDFGAWRKYTMSRGYNGKCMFGDGVFNDSEKVYVVESEKTAMLFYLYYGKPCIATGGKNFLTKCDDRYILVPDIDAIDEWSKIGNCWKWWEKFKCIGEHSDIGDAIVSRIQVVDNQQVM